jgi:hypothetical protein
MLILGATMSVFFVRRTTFVFSLYLITPITWAALSLEQEKLYEQGMIAYGQARYHEARDFLESAAHDGDAESLFFLAKSITHINKGMTPEAQKIFLASAEQGNVPAMLNIFNHRDVNCTRQDNCGRQTEMFAKWRDKALSIAKNKAVQGDAESMFQMFDITLDRHWLFKAVQANHPESQRVLANLYEFGEGNFINSYTRKWAIKRLLRNAAEHGDARAMFEYAELLLRNDDKQGAGDWMAKAANLGLTPAVWQYAAWTAHLPDEVGYPLDLIKAYGLGLVVADTNSLDVSLSNIAFNMTLEQIEEAQDYAETWKATHPPLSKFQTTYE